MMVLFLLLFIAIAVFLYRNHKDKDINKTIVSQVTGMYNKFAPYSFKIVREKTKELGQEYSVRRYGIQVAVISIFTAVITWLYFYNLIVTIIYVVVAIMFIPYLAYLRCKKVYSEFIFEQIQVYTSNTIMEFATTQSFVKSIEGVMQSGVLEDPIKKDVQHMISLAYQNGSIDESLEYFTNLYPYYIVKNMHQLFLQITKEGASNSYDSLDNMQLDIDMLVESVYRDRIERTTFHKGFLQFGVMLYILVLSVQFLLGGDSYIDLLQNWFVQVLLHGVVLGNSYFLLKGERYYNENVGAE